MENANEGCAKSWNSPRNWWLRKNGDPVFRRQFNLNPCRNLFGLIWKFVLLFLGKSAICNVHLSVSLCLCVLYLLLPDS